MKKAILLMGLLLCGAVAQAQAIKLDSIKQGEGTLSRGVWVGMFGGTDSVTVVNLNTITSVSKQSYTIDGSIPIKEVTIDTTGNNSIRIYCSTSKVKQRVMDVTSSARGIVSGRTGITSTTPGKKYPEATHSHNVEFMVETEGELDSIYESVLNAWLTGKGASYRSKK